MPLTPEPIGIDTQVNTDTSLVQQMPAVTVLSDGSFVVIWYKAYGPGQLGMGTYGQHYDASGNAIGGEFHVNSGTYDTGHSPTITALADGGFVAIWSSWGKVGDSSLDNFGQRFDANCNKVGSEFLINTCIRGQQYAPAVTALDDGGFMVAWLSYGYAVEDPISQDGSRSGIFAQRYGADGLPAGVEFRLNTTTLGYQLYPTLTTLADGSLIATWMSESQDGSDWAIVGQRMAADGSLIGGEFIANTFVSGAQQNASVTALEGGGFVISWDSAAQDGSGTGIYGQVFAADATRIGPEFRVNTFTSGNQSLPSSTPLADGGFVISWSSMGQDGSSWGQYGQRFSATGNPVGQEFAINSITAGAQFADSTYGSETLATLPDGTLVHVWAGAYSEEVFFRLIDVNLYNPTITSNGAGDDAAITISENQTFVTTVTATDLDADQTLSYSLSGADAAMFAIGTDGRLTFVTSPDFENPTDAGSDNVYDVVVQVSDGHGGTDSQAIAVAVSNVGGMSLIGGNKDQTLRGGGEEDFIDGRNGKDVLYGMGGNDTLLGGTGKDTLYGGDGRDWLDGGVGDDRLIGGTGADTFSFEGLFGRDVVTDFEVGIDRIKFDPGRFSSFDDILAHALQVGNNTVIWLDEANSVTLVNVELASLDASYFLI